MKSFKQHFFSDMIQKHVIKEQVEGLLLLEAFSQTPFSNYMDSVRISNASSPCSPLGVSKGPECTIPLAGSNHDHQRDLPEMDQTVAPGNAPPGIGEMVPPIYTQSSSPGQETIVENGG